MVQKSNVSKQQKDKMKIREEFVVNACRECLGENVKITYVEISRRTGIPNKSLERDPYKGVIYYYRNLDKRDESPSTELQAARAHINYLNDVIKQLHKENHNLKTELCNKKII